MYLVRLVALDLDADPISTLDTDQPLGCVDLAAGQALGVRGRTGEPAVVVVAPVVEVGSVVEVGLLVGAPLVPAAWRPPSSPPQPASNQQVTNRPASARRSHAIDASLSNGLGV